MAGLGGLGALGAVPGGYMEGANAAFDFNKKLQDKQDEGLAGEALMSLQSSSAQYGPGAGGGPPQQQQPPGAAQPPPASQQPQPPAGAKDWRSYGQQQPQQQPATGGGQPQQQPAKQQPAKQQPAQQQPPAQQQQPQGQPYGGQYFQQQSQGRLTLRDAITAVAQAAQRRGQPVDPGSVMRAVSKLLPSLNAEAQAEYKELTLQLREQQIQNVQTRQEAEGERIQQGWARLAEQHENNIRIQLRADKRLEEYDKKLAQDRQISDEKARAKAIQQHITERRNIITTAINAYGISHMVDKPFVDSLIQKYIDEYETQPPPPGSQPEGTGQPQGQIRDWNKDTQTFTPLR